MKPASAGDGSLDPDPTFPLRLRLAGEEWVIFHSDWRVGVGEARGNCPISVGRYAQEPGRTGVGRPRRARRKPNGLSPGGFAEWHGSVRVPRRASVVGFGRLRVGPARARIVLKTSVI
ncbi:MAG: hypothetical protein Kow001_14250 [Acidobacteriota bacterium]